MTLQLLSINYKNAPVEVRERLAVPGGQLSETLHALREACGLRELMVLSTCNRVEFYYLPGEDGADAALQRWLAERSGVADDELASSTLFLSHHEALNHIFRVACGLESMVLGEPQVLGQVKDAYGAATEAGTTGPVLNGMMQRVFRTAKRVRTETGIARFPLSVSYVAAELAGRIFESLQGRTVLVIGAGEMAELAVSHLQKRGADRLMVTNRTFANAVALAEKFQGSAVRFEHLANHMAEADIVISSTGARGYVVDMEAARQAVRARRGRPVFFIDIAVPRDIDPAVNDLADVYCYDIDDLQSVTEENRREREREAQAAQELITGELAAYEQWVQSAAVVPTVKALREHVSALGERELVRTLEQLGHLPDEDAAAIRKLVRTVVNKLLHTPSTRLKQLAEEGSGPLYADAVSTLFDLPAPGAAQAEQRREESAETESDAQADKVVQFPSAARAGD